MRDNDQDQDDAVDNDAGSVGEDESVPRLDEDHGEILRLLIGEGTEATLDMFHEAKAPDIDPILKLKLITLGSRLGDNVRRRSRPTRAILAVRAEPLVAHRRNIGPVSEAPRCGARTRAGTLCRSPAISGQARCRMHGGRGSGAPKGNRNALRHDAYTKNVIERELRVRVLCQRLRGLTCAPTSNTQPARTAKLSSSPKRCGQ